MKNLRKKLGILSTVATFSSISAISQADFMTIADIINASFGYEEGRQPIIENISPDEIVISTNSIKDNDGYFVPNFRIIYSKDLMKEQDLNTEEVMDKYGKIADEYSEESAQIVLKADADGIQRNASYYAMIVPIDIYDNEGRPSDWICFNLEREEYDVGDACQTFDEPTTVDEHGSNEVMGTENQTSISEPEPVENIEHHSSTTSDLSLANITCNATETHGECLWTAVGDANRIDIYLFDFEKGKEYLIGSPKMKDEYFRYDLTKDVQQRLRFVPDDGGTEKVFTFNAIRPQEVTKNTEPVDIKTPTGPKETTALIFVLSALGYGIYRKLARRYS